MTWALSQDHLSFFQLSGAHKYTNVMIFYTLFNQRYHSFDFWLVSCLVIGWKKCRSSNIHSTGVQWYARKMRINLHGLCLKVKQNRNDFFKTTFPSINEQKNSILLLWDLFSFVFWRKLYTTKRHFEINWPLAKFELEIYGNVFKVPLVLSVQIEF